MNANDEADRIMRLLDIGIDSARKGDFQMAELAAKAALDVAKAMPKKPDVICLPDRSGERG